MPDSPPGNFYAWPFFLGRTWAVAGSWTLDHFLWQAPSCPGEEAAALDPGPGLVPEAAMVLGAQPPGEPEAGWG